MTTREKRKLIRTKIEAGASPQQVYDELHGPGNAADEKLADLVRFVPTMERRAKYRIGQWVLMGLLCFGGVWTFAFVKPSATLRDLPNVVFHSAFGLGYFIALLAVVKYWRKAHSFAGLMAILQIMQIHNMQGGSDLLVVLLFAVLALLGVYLQRKLTPDYIKLKEKYTNSEGQARLREVVRFGD